MKNVLRYLGVFAAGMVILIGVTLAVFYLWLNSYLKSDEFRSLVSTETSKVLHLEGEYLPFHWSGFSVHSDGYDGKGDDEQSVHSVRADQIRADLNLRPILKGVWSLPRIDIQSMQIELQAPSASAVATPSSSITTTPAPSKNFFTRLLPTRVDIDTINIASLNISAPSGPPVTLRDLQVVLTQEGNGWNIDGVNGKLRHPDWPNFTVQHARLRSAPDQLFLTQVTLQMADNGLIDVSGDVNTAGTSTIHLLTDVKHAPITAFLAGDWRARIVGNLNGPVRWSGDLHGPVPVQAEGALKLLEGRIEALPFLNQIATLTKTEEFRSLKLHKASADFTWVQQTGRLEVTNLLLESEGLVRVQGKFVIEKETIDGHFSIGTVPSVLKYVPGAESQVFTEKHDGYIWAPLNLTGPVQSPADDLTPKLKAAAINSIGDTATQGLQNVIDAAKSLLPF